MSTINPVDPEPFESAAKQPGLSQSFSSLSDYELAGRLANRRVRREAVRTLFTTEGFDRYHELTLEVRVLEAELLRRRGPGQTGV